MSAQEQDTGAGALSPRTPAMSSSGGSNVERDADSSSKELGDLEETAPSWRLHSARLIGAIVAGISGLVVLAWHMGWMAAVSILPGLPSMKHNTGLYLLTLGLALVVVTLPERLRGGWAWRLRWVVVVAGGLVPAITWLEYMAGASFGIDELFVVDEATRSLGRPELIPGRMALATSLAGLLLTASLMLRCSDGRGWRVLWLARICAMGAMAIGLLAGGVLIIPFVGLTDVGLFATIPVHTGWLIALLAGGVLLAERQLGATPRAERVRLARWSGVRLALMVCGILVTGIVATVTLARAVHEHDATAARALFDKRVDHVVAEARRRVELPVYGLKGARGVYAASEAVNRSEFRRYVASRDLAREFPGAIGMGFIERVGRDRLSEFITAERVDAAPEFDVRSTGDDPVMYIIKYLEPLSVNRQAWGYDVGSEAVRREAVERAIGTGVPSLTGPVTLLQDDLHRAGFLYLVPVYANGMNPVTPEERSRDLVGLVFATIIIDHVFEGIAESVDSDLSVRVLDHDATLGRELLYDSEGRQRGHSVFMAGSASVSTNRRALSATGTVSVGGRKWAIEATATPAFMAEHSSVRAEKHLLVGLLITSLAAVVVWVRGGTYAKAVRLAESMTIELSQSNAVIERQNADLAAMADRAHRVVDDVSHEFRTPLAVIKEFASIISDGIAGPVSEQQIEYLRIMDGAVVDLNHMVEDLLDSSKLRAGRLRIDRRAHRVERIFEKGRAGLAKKAESRRIAIEERIEPGLAAVFADEEKTRRVIANLMTNAIKFSPEGGKIVLAAARGENDNEVVISVTDQGPGLSPEDVDKLFGRFQQVSTSRSVAAKGFGLGLSIAQELAWLNLGKLSVVSQKGHGATFLFTIPVDDTRSIVSHYFRTVVHADRADDQVTLLRVQALGDGGDPDEPERFLSSATFPTDLVMRIHDGVGSAQAWWILGRTDSPARWSKRLVAERTQLLAENSLRLARFSVDVYQTWDYPGGVATAHEQVLAAITAEKAIHVEEGAHHR